MHRRDFLQSAVAAAGLPLLAGTGRTADPPDAGSFPGLILREREPQEGECPNTLVRITLPGEVTKRAAIAMEAVEMRPVVESIIAPAETSYVPAAHAKVGPRAQGVVREVRVSVYGPLPGT